MQHVMASHGIMIKDEMEDEMEEVGGSGLSNALRRWGRLRKTEFVTIGPSILAKHPKNRKTVAHVINPRDNHTICPCHPYSMTSSTVIRVRLAPS
jgi:hypothetical protein